MRLASPSLPVGGFSYSEGLEAAVASARVRDEAGVLAWLVDQLHLVLARGELPVVARALGAWRSDDFARASALNRWFSATRESSELRQQAEQMGRSLGVWLRNAGTTSARLAALDALPPAPTWPVAFALAAAELRAVPRAVLLAFAAGWAENMVQSALKAVPLGQLAAQRVLTGLAAEVPAAVDAALQITFADMQASAPMLAILSSQHEEQYSRLFRS
ncbi:MAG TPA: urease accessory UreF family protein [Caldimonas sp.]|nr:urease accessory UreF family protein [Caldimonas sp.]HEX2540320.1 urease accessory UreF family protein [Caldimonas sp.]